VVYVKKKKKGIIFKFVLKKKEFLLTRAFRLLFKVSQLRNYFLKKFNILISDALNTQFFIKIYYLKFLKSALRAFVNISLIKLLHRSHFNSCFWIVVRSILIIELVSLKK